MFDAPSEIKSRIPIEDLVSQYVQLKKVGRSFKGLCPFHSEKTPSFIVSPDKGIAYCFGCHKGGDVFKFLQEVEGIDFSDALKILAEKAGVKLEEYQPKKSTLPDGKNEKEEFLRIHELSTKFYEEQLWNTKDGEKVLDYLQRRGLRPETIKMFRLGYAPDSFEATHSMLQKEGFPKKTLLASGIVSSKEINAEKVFDRFRGRLMFPIFDNLGRVVAFGGRALQKGQEPKYLNSPETIIYQKSTILYGFSFSKPFIKEQKKVLLVEGYMDAIAAYQAGLKNTVAVSGTALTTKHLRVLQPFIQTLLLGFDMDEAGQEATKRSFELTLDFDYEVKVVSLPSGKDIAEFAKDHGAEIFSLIEQAKPYGDYFLERLLQTYGQDNIYSKRKILQEFYVFLNSLKSPIEKDAYVRKVAHYFQLTEANVYDEIKNLSLPINHPARITKNLSSEPKSQGTKLQGDEIVLGILIEYPSLWSTFLKELSENVFSDDLKPIYRAIKDYYNGGCPKDAQGFISTLSHDVAEKTALLSLKVSQLYGEMSEEELERETKGLIERITQQAYREKAKELTRRMIEAEKSGDKHLSQKIRLELNEIVQKFR